VRKQLALAAALPCALALPAAAQAHISPLGARYERAYQAVAHHFGHRAPGRDIVRFGLAPSGAPASAQRIKASLGVLQRMLAPRPTYRVAPTRHWVAPVHRYTPTRSTPTGGESALVRCIVARESSGNPRAVNASGHMGLGQWAESTWLAQGGGRYAATPLGASYGEQLAVIESAVAHGGASAWTPYDGC
jgi:soluble lytic murein transglycosylase-like protein